MRKVDQNEVVTIRGTIFTGEWNETIICKTCARKNAKRHLRELENYANQFKLIRIEDALTNKAIAL